MASGRARLPWTLVAASLILLVLFAYTLFAGYLPARRRIVDLERELKSVYAREAELQTRLSQYERGPAGRRLGNMAAERDALARRVQELERELAAARKR